MQMTRRLVSFCTLMLQLAGSALVAEGETVLDFALPADGRQTGLIGAVVEESGKYRVRAVSLTVGSSKKLPQQCKLLFRVSGKREKSITVKPLRMRRISTPWGGLQLVVSRMGRESVVGRIIVPAEAEGQWRSLVARPIEAPPGATASRMPDSGLEPPTLLESRTPRYTNSAVKAGIEGRLLLQFVVSAQGRPRPDSIGVLSFLGYGLEEAAIESILNTWVFKPGTRDGKPVGVLSTAEVTFSLRRGR